MRWGWGQRSEVRGQRSEVRGYRSWVIVPTPSFPVFYFPTFIFSALPASILRLLRLLWLIVGSRREAEGERSEVIGHGLSCRFRVSQFSTFPLSEFSDRRLGIIPNQFNHGRSAVARRWSRLRRGPESRSSGSRGDRSGCPLGGEGTFHGSDLD